jgi:mannose-6-phosphate isomerase-like protein (cupin superfamily)
MGRIGSSTTVEFPIMRFSPKLQTRVATASALLLAIGWSAREVSHAREAADQVKSGTISLKDVTMSDVEDGGKKVGQNGVYISGDTPGSRNFVTGRFVIAPGQTPHAPHRHPEEEVMVIESGRGEIFCDGKTTPIGPGSVMYTTPDAPHGIVNTGTEPVVFYYIKWAGKGEAR